MNWAVSPVTAYEVVVWSESQMCVTERLKVGSFSEGQDLAIEIRSSDPDLTAWVKSKRQEDF